MDKYESIRSLPFPAVASALGIDLSHFKTRKGGELYGSCPVHKPKQNHTSFSYGADGRFNCFSCGAKGKGAIDLIMVIRGCGFQDAVDFLTVITPVQTVTPPAIAAPAPDSGLPDGILKPFVGKYHLHQAPCPWLESRVPDEASRKLYGVFYYENNARKSSVNSHVLIPIRDTDGVLFGYLARNIGEVTQERPKYRLPANLPKSKVLFGADIIKAGKFGQAPLRKLYLLESPFAVMKFATLGIPAVAAFGWSVSEVQISLLQQIAKGVCYLPDRNKRQESLPIAGHIAESLWLRFPPLPDGIDDPEYLDLPAIQAL